MPFPGRWIRLIRQLFPHSNAKESQRPSSVQNKTKIKNAHMQKAVGSKHETANVTGVQRNASDKFKLL